MQRLGESLRDGQEEGGDGWRLASGLAGFGRVCLVLSRLYGRKVGVIVNGFDLKRIPKLRESAIV